MNPGNSGGPLFHANGAVVGINAQIYSQSGGYQGLSLRALTRDEQDKAHVQGGLMVEGVVGAAARAGLLPGDVLLAINGIALKSVEQVQSVLAKKPATVALLILRGGNRIFIAVELN